MYINPELQVSAMTPLCDLVVGEVIYIVTTKLNKSGEGHHTVSSRFGSGSEASDFKVV